MNREKIQFEKNRRQSNKATWSALLVILDKSSLGAYFLGIWALCGGLVVLCLSVC